MISRLKISMLAAIIIPLFFYGSLSSSSIKNAIKSGTYIPNDLVSIESLRLLPVPATNSNYMIFQSIGKVSNIIIGNFDGEPQRITLIQDNNADGNVDVAVHWMLADKKITKEVDPVKYCSSEKFKNYKESVLRGESSIEKVDTMNLLNYLISKKENIRRVNNGFRIFVSDSDNIEKERVVYYYSDNGINGTDLLLEVKYFNIKKVRVVPIVTHYVYCKNSMDSYVKDVVKKLISKTVKGLE